MLNLSQARIETEPFPHCVIDNFLSNPYDIAQEFLPFNHDGWFVYNSAAQIKKACNNWYLFPPNTYRLFDRLMSKDVCNWLWRLFLVDGTVYADPGLHGGGWHAHGDGGILKPHLDYSIHPKLGLQRKLNLIIYVSPLMKASYGGHLGLWKGDPFSPGKLDCEIAPLFNRAVIFDTTQNSWHGMSTALSLPKDVYRQSIATYYLTEPSPTAPTRDRANFWEKWP